MEGMHFNIIKATYEKLTANHTQHVKKMKAFSLRLAIIQRCPLSPLLFIILKEAPPRAIKQNKTKKEIKNKIKDI